MAELQPKRPISRSFWILGLRVNAFSNHDFVNLVSSAVKARERFIIASHNLHSLYLCHRVSRMVHFYSIADYVLIDGMSLILLGRVFGIPLEREHRAAFLDFMPLLLPEAVKKRWRVYYLGSRPGVAERAAAQLRKEHPGLEIRTHHGYFNAEKSGKENQNVVAEIAAYAPHILFVGMGMPRQEIWILENRNDIRANVIFPCGASADYVAGEIPTAPRWTARLYLEWLYRLMSEPTRLWRRYLVEPWFILGQVPKHFLKLRSSAKNNI